MKIGVENPGDTVKDQTPKSGKNVSTLPRVRAGEHRCPHCESDKWVHVESSRIMMRRNPKTGLENAEEVPHKYGCAHCGREFYVENAMNWKRARDAKRCPHCGSDKVIVAVKMDHGAVIACLKCNNLALHEDPGYEGRVTVEDVKQAGKLTQEAQELFGERGFYFEVKREKARRRVVAGQS